MEKVSWIEELIRYLSALAPVAAVGVSVYIGVILPKKRRLESFLLYDEVTMRFIIAINNTGGSSVVLRSIELYAKSKRGKTKMGKRVCISDKEGKLITIFPGRTYSYEPRVGSVYDVLGDGVYSDFSRYENDGPVYIVATDTRGCTYKSKTGWRLKGIGDIISEMDMFAKMSYKKEKDNK